MSNSYLMFSTGIDNLTDEEMNWCEGKIKEINEWTSWDDDCTPSGINFQLQKERKEIWIVCEEGGDPAFVADFFQEFLKANRPKSFFHFTWSLTCSKMVLDEFSGGGVFVTASKQKWFSPETMFDKEIQRMNKKKAAEV